MAIDPNRNHPMRLLFRVVAVVCFALAVIIPVVVLSLRATGVIGPHQYYPHPAAWPTIFATAFLLTIGANVIVWLRLTARSGFGGSRVAVAVPILVIGSIVAVNVLAFVGIAIYFQLPVE